MTFYEIGRGINTSAITIDFLYDGHLLLYYFEINHLEEISLYKVHKRDTGLHSDTTVLLRVELSCNPKYADWLKENAVMFQNDLGELQSNLGVLYNNNLWFQSLEHLNGSTKYRDELERAIETLDMMQIN